MAGVLLDARRPTLMEVMWPEVQDCEPRPDRVGAVGLRGCAVVPGEHQTVEALFRAEYVNLVRALTLACGNPDDAADAVQDAFVQAERHWRRVHTYDNPAAWLRRVAVNRLSNRRRGDQRRQAYLERTREQLVEQDPLDLDLHAAVASLPPGQRMVVGLHYLADLSVDEVAAAMRVSPGTVKSQLYDARNALALRQEVSRDQ